MTRRFILKENFFLFIKRKIHFKACNNVAFQKTLPEFGGLYVVNKAVSVRCSGIEEVSRIVNSSLISHRDGGCFQLTTKGFESFNQSGQFHNTFPWNV
jgi:hypothetical protein